jgi:hypothetical protein
MTSVLKKPSLNPILHDYENEETIRLNKVFDLFAGACRSQKEQTIWETFEETRQNHFWYLMRGLELAGIHNQVDSLKTLACLLRDEDFIKRRVTAYGGENATGFLMDWWNRDLLEPVHANIREFMYEFIPSLAKTQYFHQTPWFRLMVAYVLKRRDLEFLIIDLLS